MSFNPTALLPMVTELLSYDDEQFLQCAYYAILGRKPDMEGMAVYLKRLRKGVSKTRVLGILARSSEARTNGTGTVSLQFALKLRSILDSSILGSLARLLWKEPATVTISDSFDPVWYLQEYPDVAKGHFSPYFHFVHFGMEEGRCPAFDALWYLSEYPDVLKSGFDPKDHYYKYGHAQKRYPWFGARWYLKQNPDVASLGMQAYEHYNLVGRREGRPPAYIARDDYRKWLSKFDTLTAESRDAMHAHSERFEHKPLLSIIAAVNDANPKWLMETLDSVQAQIYQKWELCVVYDPQIDHQSRSILERYASEDHRIKTIMADTKGCGATAKNLALESATGEWTILLDPNDLFAEGALFWMVDAINNCRQICMIYSDDDKVSAGGVRFDPHFRCDWNPDLFYSHPMFAEVRGYLTSAIRKVSGFRANLRGAEDCDLTLRCIEHLRRNQIFHVSRVLYHRRVHGESRHAGARKFDATAAGESALNEHFVRMNVGAKACSTAHGYRVCYTLPVERPLISLIIPTRNGLGLLRQCVESIIQKTAYRPFEILIVDNGSDDPETLHYLKNISLDERVIVIRDERVFNYSALNNAAVREAKGVIIGLINNDIEVINPEWLSEMASHALRPEVGAVGARLWYPDDTLQHGGVILGRGRAWHAHRYIAKIDPGYMGRAACVQSLSAVTGACLLVRKSVYDELQGLNEADLPVTFNDIDFCIRALKAGYTNIWTPYADLYHHESATRGNDDVDPTKRIRARRELTYMQTRWARELKYDPAYNPNLTDEAEDFSLAWPPRADDREVTPAYLGV